MCSYTQVQRIKCSDINESVELHKYLGLGIYFGLCANISLCFSLKAVQSLGNCSIKTPYCASWCSTPLESLFLGLQNELLFDSD